MSIRRACFGLKCTTDDDMMVNSISELVPFRMSCPALLMFPSYLAIQPAGHQLSNRGYASNLPGCPASGSSGCWSQSGPNWRVGHDEIKWHSKHINYYHYHHHHHIVMTWCFIGSRDRYRENERHIQYSETRLRWNLMDHESWSRWSLKNTLEEFFTLKNMIWDTFYFFFTKFLNTIYL